MVIEFLLLQAGTNILFILEKVTDIHERKRAMYSSQKQNLTGESKISA